MKPICYTCKHRMHRECDGNLDTFAKKNGTESWSCKEYERTLLKDVIDKDDRMYELIDDFTHLSIGTFTGAEAKEKYGERIWYSGYTEYSKSLEWIECDESYERRIAK